jgi:hypothetical protein
MYTQPSTKEIKFQHSGARLAAVGPPRHLCYRPTVFFHPLRLDSREEKFGAVFKKKKIIVISPLFFNCVSLKLRNWLTGYVGV